MKKNVLILGVNGLIGSTLGRVLGKSRHLKVYGTVRKKISFLENCELINSVDAFNIEHIYDLIIKNNINFVINCIGLTKHKDLTNSIYDSGYLNAVFPHKLSFFTQKCNAKLIHISSDCVFSGKNGNYNESSKCDATDTYGVTKYLGELSENQGLTIRTSTIGHELETSYGLLNWFMRQKKCFGYSKAFFSGTTTLELANTINRIILEYPSLCGVYNIGGTKISKFDLLKKINDIYKLDIDIKCNDEFFIDRSFSSARFCRDTGYSSPNWDSLINDMKEEFFAANK